MSAGRGPWWLELTDALARALLSRFPETIGVALRDEIRSGMGVRLLRRRDERGLRSALTLAGRELFDLWRAGVEARRECARAVRVGAPGAHGFAWRLLLDRLRAGLAQAARGVVRRPGIPAFVVAVVTIGAGTAAAIFGVVHTTMIRPLPFPDADRVVHVWGARSWQGVERGLLADEQVRSISMDATTLEAVSALWMVSGRILGGSEPVHTDVARVSASFFDLLGIDPYLGRTFRQGEDRTGAEWVTVLEYDYWQSAFDGDPGIVGRRVTVGWQEMEVIGVLPPDFYFDIPPELGAHGQPDLWIPWWHGHHDASDVGARVTGGTLALVGRVGPEHSVEDARRELVALGASEDHRFYGGQGFRFRLEPIQSTWVREARGSLLVLLLAGVLLLAIAVANAALLLLTRARQRADEFGVREALGASRGVVGRLIFAESVVLATVVGIAAAAVAEAETVLLTRLLPEQLAPLLTGSVGLGPWLLGVAVVLGCGLFVGVASRPRPIHGLPVRTGRSRLRRRGVLVAVQVALSCVMLVAAGLLTRTLVSLEAQPLGFDPAGRLSFSVYLMDEYDTHERQLRFYEELTRKIRGIPGVISVSGASALPLSGIPPLMPVSTVRRADGIDPETFFLTEGFSTALATELDAADGEDYVTAGIVSAHPRWFETAGVGVRSGRGILGSDTATREPVVFLDTDLADRLWSAEAAVGERLWVAGAWRRVAGVVDPVRLVDPRVESRPVAYLPNTQVRSGRVSMVVHAEGDPWVLGGQIRDEIAELDALVPIGDMRPLSVSVASTRERDRVLVQLMLAFAAVSMLLVWLGTYGVVAGAVAERKTEFAVRLALGCRPVSVARRALAAGLAPTVVGLVLGIGVARYCAQLLSPVLHGVAPTDLPTFAASAILLLGVATTAVARPVSSTRHTDCSSVLRAE